MATCVILLNVCRPTERSDSAVHRKSQLCHSVFQQPTLASTTPELVIIFRCLLLSSSPLPPPNRMSPAWLASHLVPKTDAQGSCIPSQSYLRQLSCDSFFTGAYPSPDCGLLREPPCHSPIAWQNLQGLIWVSEYWVAKCTQSKGTWSGELGKLFLSWSVGKMKSM